MSEDERALRDRLAALESEVKADADAQRARKEAALTRLRAARAAKLADRDEERQRTSSSARRGSEGDDAPRSIKNDARDIGNALELARHAQGVKAELSRPTKKGDKSWRVSAGLSAILGPIGWLYAGSWREAVPASAAWVVMFSLLNWILPTILLLPALVVAMPLSGVAGALYALSHNRKGARQRLFGEDKKKPAKPLAAGNDDD